MKSTHLALIASSLLLGASTAHATETITYTYDAQGRVKQVQSQSTAKGPTTVTHCYDRAHNRHHVNVTKTTNGYNCPAIN